MKKTQFMLLLILACAVSIWAGGQKEAAAAKPVELEFPSWQAEEPGFAEFWKEVIPEFEKQNPNVTVKLSQIPFKQYIDTLTTRFAASDPPDILHLPARNVAQFAAQGWLEPLDARLKAANILGNWTPLQDSMVYDGKNMGLLLMGYGYILYYNEKMLKDAGVAVPTTTQEFIKAARALTNESAGIFGVGWTTAEHPNIYGDVTQVVYGEGLSFFKDGKYNFTDPKVINAVDMYRQLTRYAPKGTTTELKRQLFVDGKVAMIIDGPWVAAMVPKAAESVKPYLKLALPPFPVTPGNPSNSMHIPGGLDAQTKDLVWKFIELIASPKFQARYTILTSSPAGRKGALTADMVKEHPDLKVINEAASLARNTWPESSNVMANYNQFSKIVSDAMLKLMLTDVPARQVLDDLLKQLSQEIQP